MIIVSTDDLYSPDIIFPPTSLRSAIIHGPRRTCRHDEVTVDAKVTGGSPYCSFRNLADDPYPCPPPISATPSAHRQAGRCSYPSIGSQEVHIDGKEHGD